MGCRLLGTLFAAARTTAYHIAVQVYFHHKLFIVVRSFGGNQHILYPFLRVLLDDLLRRVL